MSLAGSHRMCRWVCGFQVVVRTELPPAHPQLAILPPLCCTLPMKPCIHPLLIGLIGLGASLAAAQNVSLYGANGQSAGRVVQNGKSVSIYGPNGQSAGRAVQSSDSIAFYGAQGTTAGRANRNTIQYYAANGQSAGRASQTGDTTAYYAANGQAAGRAVASPSGLTFYSANGRYLGRATPAGNPALYGPLVVLKQPATTKQP